MSLLAYGVLRGQLFDIDLRIRIAVEHGTVGGLIAGSFFLVSQVLEAAFPVEGFVQGAVMALVIAALLRPVQLLARRFTERLMPQVSADDAYLTRRKLDVYRGALEAALESPEITDAERGLLRRLRERLGIDEESAAVLEQDLGVRRARPAAPPAEGAT
jgi:hypothetical protein